MLRGWCVVLLCALVYASAACAQSAEDTFRDSLVKKQFVLRNFSGQTKVNAKWTGTQMEFDEPPWRVVAVIDPESVTFSDQRIVIKGIRHGLIYDGAGKLGLINDPEPVEIDVDLPAGTMEQALPLIKNNLFFATRDEALAAVPKEYESIVPTRMSPMPSAKPKEICDCARAQIDPCDSNSPDMKAPRLVHGQDVSATEAMKRKGSSGTVKVVLTVNATGHVENLWVAKPMEHDADEQVALIVAKYVFRPATCRNKPVAVTLDVDMNFKIDGRH